MMVNGKAGRRYIDGIEVYVDVHEQVREVTNVVGEDGRTTVSDMVSRKFAARKIVGPKGTVFEVYRL